MIKQYRRIVVVGGASPLWTPPSVCQMATLASMQHATVVLYDVAYDRAAKMADVCNRIIRRAFPDTKLKVVAARTLDEALPGADIVITCYRNGGHDTETRLDDLAKKYGSDQNSFTAGPGGCLYVAVQAAPMIGLVSKMRALCPDAYLLNESNPLPAMCMVAIKVGWQPLKTLGYCGNLAAYTSEIANFVGVDADRVKIEIGGTNHCTFITGIWIDGKESMDVLRKTFREKDYFDLGMWGRSGTEIRIARALNYMVAGGHASDILPTLHGDWLPPTDDAPPRPAEFGENFLEMIDAYASGQESKWTPPTEPYVPFTWLEALAGGTRTQRFSVNITNGGATANAPDWAVIDLESEFDVRGVRPLRTSPLPEVVAEVVRRHQVVFEMAARAAVTGDRALLVNAVQLCPFVDMLEKAEAIVDEAKEMFGAAMCV